MNSITPTTNSGPQGAGAGRPNERPQVPLAATAAKRSRKSTSNKRIMDDPANYYAEALAGLEGTRTLPAAAIPWDPSEPPRWRVRPGTKGKSRTHALMFGPKAIKTGNGAQDFNRLISHAEYLNKIGHTPPIGKMGTNHHIETSTIMKPETETADSYNEDDILTIRDTLRRLGIECNDVNRVAFNHVVDRGELKKARTCRIIYLRWGDVLKYMANGTHHLRRRKSGPRKSSAHGDTTKSNEDALVAEDCEILPPVEDDSDDPCDLADGVTEAVALQSEITAAEALVASLVGMSDEKLIEVVATCATEAGGFAAAIIATGKRYIVAAWQSGIMLNRVKAARGHGAFGQWLEEFSSANATSVRTLQRYMKVAKICPDIRLLVNDCNNLRAAYSALGIAGAQPDTPPSIGDGEATEGDTGSTGKSDAGCTAAKVLASASTLQKNLRRFHESGSRLDADEMRQIKLVMLEIQNLIDQHPTTNNSNRNAA